VEHALDAGCGHGICSLVLAEIADRVTAVDVSSRSLETAREQARNFGRPDITFIHQDLRELSLPGNQFDLVWCWGVATNTPDPIKVIENLCRVTKPGGVIYLGLYLKTWLSPVHDAVRYFCRTFMSGPFRKHLVCRFFSQLTKAICFVRGQDINLRADNVSIEAQVEDWYYVPFKGFFSIDEVIDILSRNAIQAECIQDRLGRMKSATIFVTRGVKRI